MLRNILVGLFLSSAILLSCNPPKDASQVSSVETAEVIDDTEESTGIIDTPTDSVDEEGDITWDDCGGAIGDKACDFTFTDQNGDDWNLYDHYGTVMILDFSTVWCGVCRTIAGDVQMHQDTFTAQGFDFIWVTILVDGNTWGTSPTKEEIENWVNTYGMTTSPVLLGDRTIIDTTGANGYPVTGWPTLVIVDETLTIAHGINGWNEAAVMSWLESVLQNAQ